MPARYTLGIDLGGTHTALAVVDARNVSAWETSFPTNGVAGFQDFITRVSAAAAAAHKEFPYQAVAVAAAAQVNPSNGWLVASPNLGFQDVPLGPALSSVLALPVLVENDVNAAAYGEFTAGPAGEREPLLAVFVGTGVGGGLVAGGDVFRGADGFAVEIGHIPVVREGGEPCGCGRRGCLEAYAGGLGITRRGQAARARAGAPFGDAGEVVAAAAAGDGGCSRVLAEAAAYLGMALAAAVNLFNPATLVLGGGVVSGWPPLYDRAREHLREAALPSLLARLEIRRSLLGSRAGAIGAAALARRLIAPSTP